MKAAHQILVFIRKNTVMLIAALAAGITAFLVPPDEEYLSYIDYKTITCLFCTLAVVCALRNIRFFYTVAERIVSIFCNLRNTVLALVYITFIGSMLIANDMALLTFLPLGYFILLSTGKEEYMCKVFILQNIAANLGGMLTPFGNPQNLYLYSAFSIPDGAFFLTMLPPFLLAIAMITLSCFLFFPKEPIEVSGTGKKLPRARVIVYLILFALSILIVFRTIPYPIGLIVITLSLLFLDPIALTKVDYGLLFTFVFFFVFAGNMSRIGAVRTLFSSLLEKNTLLVSALSCQVISNVPSAILLSRFATDWKPLLLGVNIGGCGTIISSLASLITFREYCEHNPGKAGHYLAVFSAFNFTFLLVMLLFCSLILAF